MNRIILFLSVFLVFSPLAFLDCAVTRAAFDLGSGKFKLIVAEVDEKKTHIKCSKMIDVKLAEDFAASPDGCLSARIELEAQRALQELKEEAVKQGARQFSGIATAVFRKAKNGADLLMRLERESGIELHLISQEKEGEIGFNTALLLSPELPEENLLSWDSGNASFQITAKENDEYLVCEGPLGGGLVAKEFIEGVRGVPFSGKEPINPISFEETKKLSLLIQERLESADWLTEKLAQEETIVVALGDARSIFGVAAKGIGSAIYSKEEVQTLIESLADRPNEELAELNPTPQKVLTGLVFLHAVMNRYDMKSVIFKESTGSTLGMLIDPTLWAKGEKISSQGTLLAENGGSALVLS